MPEAAADLPPLQSNPPAFGHNGGPPLDEPRRAGRPTVSTPEVRARVLDLLGEGMLLREICRTSRLHGHRRSMTGAELTLSPMPPASSRSGWAMTTSEPRWWRKSSRC